MSDNLWQNWKPQDLLSDDISIELNSMTAESISAPAQYESDELLQAELTRIRQQAEKKGFIHGETRGLEEGKQRGFDEGMRLGKEEGLAQGLAESRAQQDESVERLLSLFTSFKSALDSLDSVIPSRLVQLSITTLRSLFGKHIVLDNAHLLEKIQQVVKEDVMFKDDVQLWVSLEDVDMVDEKLGATLTSMGWTLRGDADLLSGGCRITSKEGEIDATLETRWQELCHLCREGSL